MPVLMAPKLQHHSQYMIGMHPVWHTQCRRYVGGHRPGMNPYQSVHGGADSPSPRGPTVLRLARSKGQPLL